MDKRKLQLLLNKYLDNSINKEDYVELFSYLKDIDVNELVDLVDPETLNLDKGPEFSELQAKQVFARITSDPRFINKKPSHDIQRKPRLIHLYQEKWLRLAGIIIVCFAVVLYLLKPRSNHQIVKNNNNKERLSRPIVPGGNQATLILANGNVIILDSAKNGLLVKSAKTNFLKTSSGHLVYNTSITRNPADSANQRVIYNILSTRKGGEYQLTLPDGTKVWLNSASALSFPVAFNGNQRLVKLSGEAYFEVAKNRQKPFIVNINNVQVSVLGTHFNISAYNDDDAIVTTLLEGTVQISSNGKHSLLKPGQQASVNNNGGNISVSATNTDEAIAWKNGYFMFDNESIYSVLKKVSRWYDVKIEYRGNIDNQRIGGTFYRSKTIIELLDHLKQIGNINFKIEGRRIIVIEQ